MRLSVVTTMYRSSPYLREFYERVSAVAREFAGTEYEIVFVNDGSPDDSLVQALALRGQDSRVRVIDLSRNFGHHAAMWVGLSHARGEQVFLIDCDLEESPEWLMTLAQERERQQADVAYGVQIARAGSRLSRWGGVLFYRVFNLLSETPIPQNVMTVRLMSRRYVDALLRHAEVNITIAGLWARTGFLQVPVALEKKYKKSTSYSFWKRAQVFVHALTSYSSKPLVWIFWLGLSILMLSSLTALALIIARTFGVLMDGWASLMVSIWGIGGLILFCQGVQGIYLSKVYAEVKRRPMALIREIHEDGASQDERIRPAA